jgi:DNA helicase IV
MGWFSFLLSQGVRPYQRAILRHPGIVRGLNFHGKRPRGASATDLEYFLDVKGNRGVWRDGVSDLVCRIDDSTGGLVIARLEDMFAHIYIDEVQDLVGYDLDVLDVLFESRIGVTVVGDPRQHLFATNEGPRNKKYRGAGLLDWFDERSTVCRREDRAVSYRCHQDICDFASALFPNYPPMKAAETHDVEHAGIHQVSSFEALAYADRWAPKVLRHQKSSNTQGLAAMNFGVSKGSTFDRVLIYPTAPMRSYLEHRDPAQLKRPESLYVAVTRARFSAAFVI